MEIEGFCPLPVKPGMTVAQATEACYQSELGADTYAEEFEGWVDIEALEPGDPGRKIVCCVEDGICITVEMKYMELPITDTFYGVDLNCQPGEGWTTSLERVARALEDKGLEVVKRDSYVLLPDVFVAIEVGETIGWFDPAYWSREEFLEEAILA
ncbi:hypothetical protein FRC0036_00469 [Corynebacterium diphtheriae]|uniref:hypothetical protein n=1 Tax=Corynebacterium diphtheriae TaxID=1717 RepID=UPI0013CAAD6F|nr:hypothetical protein [Corynebacterium diphtheriae]MBG9276031.1 hypothetical protein [Corynebacterium diphtheriae bv. mitis]MBG9280425.1 hypothetical protein [Corynebacterium diphtheriae bv. mitis]CAB0681061.1 hypothetical protein FRC0030_00471 [Corynebacterium diphtheriae]CAB0681098.1 hypothetical protein FRC0036_00469 [Corynebacterium diphtheriae]CAB0681259.1 hypothetical protein FRC0025_00494 [Corynebacterium diphtheriae]